MSSRLAWGRGAYVRVSPLGAAEQPVCGVGQALPFPTAGGHALQLEPLLLLLVPREERRTQAGEGLDQGSVPLVALPRDCLYFAVDVRRESAYGLGVVPDGLGQKAFGLVDKAFDM